MSRTIENRVVEMQFKNQQFETAINKSIASLAQLNDSINLLGGTKALKSLDTSVKNLDFSNINNGVSLLSDRFSTLGIISMSAINSITSALTNNLLGALSNVSNKITGLFSTIKEKGVTRAMALQQARFSFQGLISASDEQLDEIQTAERIEEIMKAVNNSVADTPYSLAQAASAASVLAAAYGTSQESITKIESSLKTISGLAAQTGADYQQVSNIMTTVSSSGYMMGDELRRLEALGLGASTYLQKYFNKLDAKKIAQLNAALSTKKNKRKKDQEISIGDIRDLASKRYITSDIVNEVFGVFFDNAQKANDTMKGVTENIGAALGRLGALFAEPIVANQGPLVKLLQVVKAKISEVANVLKEFKIDKNVTDIIGRLFEQAKNILEMINATDFSIFENAGKLFDRLNTALSMDNISEVPTAYEDFTRRMENYVNNNPLKSYNEILEETAKELTGLYSLNIDSVKKLDENSELNGIKVKDIITEASNRLQAQSDAYNEAEQGALEAYSKLKKDTIDVWNYDYIQTLIDSFTNLKEAFAEIGSVIADNIDVPELQEFINLIFGDNNEWSSAKTLREIINNIAESIKSATQKFKDFVENNESFRKFVGGIGSAFTLIWRVLKAVKEIAVNAFNSLKPLFERLGSLGGAFGELFSGLVDLDNESDGFAKVVDVVSAAIDKLAKVLISAYDGIEGFLKNSTGFDNLLDFFTTLASSLKPIGNIIGSAFDKITSVISGFFDFIGGLSTDFKVSDIFNSIRSIFSGGESGESIFDTGIIENVEETIETVEDGMEVINDGTESVTKSTGTFADLLDPLLDNLKAIEDKIRNNGSEIANKILNEVIYGLLDPDVMLSRLDKFVDILSTIAIVVSVVVGIFRGTDFKGKIKQISGFIATISKIPFSGLQGTISNITTGFQNIVKEWQKPELAKAKGEVIKDIAIFIGAFAVSVLLLSFSLKMLGSIKPEFLIRGGIALAAIMAGLVVIIVVLMLIVKALKGADTNSFLGGHKEQTLTAASGDAGAAQSAFGLSREKNSAAGIIAAMAAFLFVFAIAVSLLSQSLVALAEVAKDKESFERAQGALFLIGGLIAGLMLVVYWIVSRFIDKYGKDIETGSGPFKKATKIDSVINSISILLTALGNAINLLVKALINLSDIPADQLAAGTMALAVMATIIAVLMAEVMGITYFILKNDKMDPSNEKKFTKIMIAMGAMVMVIAIAIGIISFALAELSKMDADAVKGSVVIILEIAAILAAFTIIVFALANNFEGPVSNLVATAITIGLLAFSLAGLCVSIGLLAYLLGSSGMTVEEISTIIGVIAAFIGGMVIIAAVIGALAGDTGVVLAGIAVVAILIAAIGAAALGIGAGVLLFAAGIMIFAQAIELLINVFSKLESSQVEKIVENLGTFVSGLAAILIAGFLKLVTVISDNKDAILNALITIVSFILEALAIGIVSMFKSYLDILGTIMDMLLEWVVENEERIKTLLEHVLDLVWFVLTEFFHHLFVFIGGEDGHGGVLGDLLTLLFGFLEDVLFDEEKGIIPFLTRAYYHITNWLQENAEPMADEMAATIVVVINALADAINEHGADFIDAVNNLIGAVINTIKYALGLPTDPSFETPSGTAGGDDPKNYIQDFVKAMMPGWFVTMDMAKKIGQFVTDIKNKLVEKVNAVKDKIKEIGENFANDFIEGVKKLLQIASPSRTMAEIAAYTVEGFVEEVNDNARTALQAGAEFATAYTRGVERTLEGTNGKNVSFSDALKKKISLLYSDLQALFGDTFDNFTITPTMDLTQITEGFGSIEDMMNGNSSFDISALSGNLTDSLSATDTASGFDDANAPQTSMLDNLNTDTVVNFTQNNYSPESLSRIDIYRDTKNILSNPSAISQIVTALK